MKTSLNAQAIGAHREKVENVQPQMAKADLTNREDRWRRRIGSAVEATFKAAGLNQQQAADALGRDRAQVARWCGGTERPQFDVLFSVDAFQQALVIELAKLATDGIEIVTEIRVRRSA